MYIKRNPNLQLMCWQEDPVPASLVTNLSPPSIKGDSSHEIFEFFQFVLLPLLRYLKRLIVDLGYKYRNCISQNKIIKFLIPLRRLFFKSQQMVHGQGSPSNSTTTEHQRPSKTSSSIGSPRV